MEYFIHSSSFVDNKSIIGKGTKIWHFCNIMNEVIIGQNCTIGQNCFIAQKVQLGNKVKVQNNVSIYTGVICDDDVFLGPSMVFTNVINPRSSISKKNEFKQTIIKKGVTIGANATIICGITIGEYAFIGAGAVVTKNILPYSLVIGNPAKHIGWINEIGNKMLFDKEGIYICPQTNKRYKLTNNIVKAIK